MSDWSAALDARVALIRWWEGGVGAAYADAYAEAVRSEPGQEPAQQAAAVLHREASRLRVAPSYWVTPDMMEVISHAAESMPPEPLVESDLPTTFGYVLFPRPWVVDDIHGKPLRLIAVSWGPCSSQRTDDVGMALVFYAPDDDIEDGLSSCGMTPAHVAPWWYGQDFMDKTNYVYARTTYPEIENVTERAVETASRVFRLMKALWTISQQRLLGSIGVAQATRHARKRAERAGVESTVRVITLRRVCHPGAGDESQEVRWSHRWLVRGHWALRHARDGDRLVYILPYVKGPENRPLLVKDTVFRVAR